MSEYPKAIETEWGTFCGHTVRKLWRVNSPEEEKRVREMSAGSVREADELQAEALRQIRAVANE